MKYYGERTKKLYETSEECEQAELEAQEAEEKAKAEKEQAIAERKADAEKVEAARKAMVEAQQSYAQELNEFCKKYGTYHYTVKNIGEIPSLFSFVDSILKL